MNYHTERNNSIHTFPSESADSMTTLQLLVYVGSLVCMKATSFTSPKLRKYSTLINHIFNII
ncbi:hypothetical protein Hanom_Chr04g00371541 [Helianthus anomalus]